MKNVNFLLGAGTSSEAVPSMEKMQQEISGEIPSELADFYKNINKKI